MMIYQMPIRLCLMICLMPCFDVMPRPLMLMLLRAMLIRHARRVVLRALRAADTEEYAADVA